MTFLYNLIELVLKYHDILMDLIECPAKKKYLALKITKMEFFFPPCDHLDCRAFISLIDILIDHYQCLIFYLNVMF